MTTGKLTIVLLIITAFGARLAFSQSDPSGPETFTGIVDSAVPNWQPLLSLKEGEKAIIRASGTWANKNADTGPFGNTGQPKAGTNFAAPGFNQFALLGRVGNGAVYQFQRVEGYGSDDLAKLELRGPGDLYFMVNDGFPHDPPDWIKHIPDVWRPQFLKEHSGFDDNKGTLKIRIWVIRD